jgi:hypothetical protein
LELLLTDVFSSAMKKLDKVNKELSRQGVMKQQRGSTQLKDIFGQQTTRNNSGT